MLKLKRNMIELLMAAAALSQILIHVEGWIAAIPLIFAEVRGAGSLVLGGALGLRLIGGDTPGAPSSRTDYRLLSSFG